MPAVERSVSVNTRNTTTICHRVFYAFKLSYVLVLHIYQESESERRKCQQVYNYYALFSVQSSHS